MSIVHLTDDNLNNVVGEGIVLVDFYADWCGPCKMLAPVLEVLATELNEVSIVKVNVDTNPKTAEEYGIMSIPSLIIFKDGKAVASRQGFMSKDMLIKWIDDNK